MGQISGYLFSSFTCQTIELLFLYVCLFVWSVTRDLLIWHMLCCKWDWDSQMCTECLLRGESATAYSSSCLGVLSNSAMINLKAHFICLRTVLEPCLSLLGIRGPGCGSHSASLFLAGDVATGLHQPHHPRMCSLVCVSYSPVLASLTWSVDWKAVMCTGKKYFETYPSFSFLLKVCAP